MSERRRQRRPRDPRTGRLYRMVGSVPKLTPPPKALREAKLDNLALIPGNMLPLKAEWQAEANKLPRGTLLIILPRGNPPSRKILQDVANIERAKGHAVTIIERDAE